MANIRGYTLGDIPAKGAFTSEIELDGAPPLQALVNSQDADRIKMDERPGMYLKYVPHAYDAVTGVLRMGGAYLFDTYENATDYADWTANEYIVGEPPVKFWNQSMFKSAKRFVWQVIGATNFGPVESHAVGRFQRWAYAGANVEEALRQSWPALKNQAKAQGAQAAWLLHNPKEKLICIQLAFDKVDGDDAISTGHMSLAYVAAQASLDAQFSNTVKLRKIFDQTSLFVAMWLPQSRVAGGAHQFNPMYPTFPAVQK
ncbi:hypothetical protein HJFPF1_03986 [Paramyrothecium foliicola]|nr:hypothetical protein HJFPF1_03986 [Paramyrothecium foliicola]